jgi:hypothetical protein
MLRMTVSEYMSKHGVVGRGAWQGIPCPKGEMRPQPAPATGKEKNKRRINSSKYVFITAEVTIAVVTTMGLQQAGNQSYGKL